MLARILALPAVLLMLALTGAAVLEARYPIALGMPSFAWAMASGAAVMLTAVTIAGAAMMQMKKHRTTVEPGQRPATLVTSGIFARTRNPIYLAMVLFVLAIALMADAGWFILAAIVLCIALDRIVIASEQRMIGEAFGEEYAAYRRRVRRWI